MTGPDAATGQMPEGILRQEGSVYSNHDGFWCWLATSERWGLTRTVGSGTLHDMAVQYDIAEDRAFDAVSSRVVFMARFER